MEKLNLLIFRRQFVTLSMFRFPSSYDGRFLSELFDPGYVSQHPVRIQQVQTSQYAHAAEAGFHSEDDEKALEERFAGLGYIE